MKLISTCLALYRLLAVASATSTEVEGSTSQRSVMTKPCTLFKREPVSPGKESHQAAVQWLCRVHISDRVLYGTKALLPIRGISDQFLLDHSATDLQTTLFSQFAEFTPEAIHFHPDFAPIVSSQSIDSNRKLNHLFPVKIRSMEASSPDNVSTGRRRSSVKVNNIHRTDRTGLNLVGAASASAHLSYSGGPLIANVKVVTIFWGTNVQYSSNMERFYSAVTNSNWMRIMNEYSTSSTTIGMGSWVQSYYDTTAPTTGTGTNGAVSDSDITNRLVSLINARSVPTPDKNTYYAIHFAPNISIDSGGGSLSCVAFCGYHSAFSNPTSNKASVPYIYYGIMPDLLVGQCSRVCGSFSALNNLYTVSSHELAEMVTDPYPGKGWWDYNSGYEIADICAYKPGNTTGSDGVIYQVEAEWSNKANACISNAPGTPAPVAKNPTRRPSKKPTRKPTRLQTKKPTKRSTRLPTLRRATRKPTKKPTAKPSRNPTKKPTVKPSSQPSTAMPTISMAPTVKWTANLTITFMTDDYPKETYIEIYDMTNLNELAYHAPSFYTHKRAQYTLSDDVDDSNCYWVFMEDTYGDGFCCEYGSGWYEIYWDGDLVTSSTFEGGDYEVTQVNCLS